MDQNLPADHDRAVGSVVGYPTIGRPVAREDWFLLWGPLGMMALLALMAVAVLWRRLIAERAEAAEALAAANKRLEVAAHEHAEKLEELTREHAEQWSKIAEEGHKLAGSLRDVLDATKSRIVR